MLTKSVFQSMLLALVLLFSFSVSAYSADEPTIQQVYDTANAGKLEEAQAMMQRVLAAHPSSAKAHFVEAELLAKQGHFDAAQTELDNANRLAPGLPFAKAGAVDNLKSVIAGGKQHANRVVTSPAGYTHPVPVSSGPPWGLIIIGVALIGFIIFAVKFMANRNQPVYMQNGAPGFGSGMPGQPQPYPYPGAGGPMMGGGPGIGSGIVGGLVTGAALGAGMVAGEELMHHFTDGDRNAGHVNPPQDDYIAPQNDNMGGNDFGISDSSSWDSGGSDSSGGDW